jgi:carbon monoxide dehydrogenase subunit G
MTCFSATNHSEAVVAADRKDVWAALTDPVLLPRLTPLLRSIDTDGDTWRWHLTRLTVLGIGLSPVFTEQMTFHEPDRIDYAHRPVGRSEIAGADGWYLLSDTDAGGTHLEIELTMHVDLPLPRAAKPAVTGVMRTMMQHTGDRFAANLLDHLGVPAA